MASQWLTQNVPAGSKILIEPSHNTPPMGSYYTAPDFNQNYVLFANPNGRAEKHDYFDVYAIDTYRFLYNPGVSDQVRRTTADRLDDAVRRPRVVNPPGRRDQVRVQRLERPRLAESGGVAGGSDRTRELNVKGARLARQVAPPHGFVAGSIGPTSRLPQDYALDEGVTDEAYEATFREQAEALVQAGIGVDLWDRFDGQRARYGQDFACPPLPDATHPEVTATIVHAGNVHFPPNAYCHYQYDRDLPVLSDANDWANFPNLTGGTTLVNASTWGATQEGFLVWWLGRMPRHPGSTHGVRNDWWRYVFPSSHGRAATGHGRHASDD